MTSRSRVPALCLPSACKHSAHAFVGPLADDHSSNQQELDTLNLTSDLETLYDSDSSHSDWDSDSVSSNDENEIETQWEPQIEAERLEWKQLTVDDECHLRQYFTESLVWISSYDAYFTDLVHRPCPTSYTIVSGFLLVRRREESMNGRYNWLLLPPLFKALPGKIEQIAMVMKMALQTLPGGCFDAVSEKYLSLIQSHLAQVGLASKLSDPGEWDYIYSSQQLITLDGSSSLKEKRRRARTFASRYSPAVIPLSPENWSQSLLSRCLQVAEGWVEENDTKVGSRTGDSDCLRDHKFTLGLLKHFDMHPNMCGVLVEVKDQPVALALAELEPGGRTLLSHVEKALLRVVPESAFSRGLYPFVLQANVEQFQKVGYELVNRESDDGVPGLRESKNLYKPIEWRKKFMVLEAPV